MTTIDATPVKRRYDSSRKTPKSDKRSALKSREEKTEPQKKSPLFKKIRKHKKPL